MIVLETQTQNKYSRDPELLYEMESQQEAHGPHRSTEIPVQINEYIWAKLWLYIYYKIGPVFQEEEIFKFCECAFAIL